MATPTRRVVDSSPLIFLAKTGNFELLRAGVTEIIVPDAVLAEVGVRGPADPVMREIEQASWLVILPSPPTPSRILVWDLGDGESSALTIASSNPSSEVLLDDRDARRCAKSLQIEVRGTLGLVLLAKKIGMLQSARPIVEEPRQAGLFLSDQIADQALALVNE